MATDKMTPFQSLDIFAPGKMWRETFCGIYYGCTLQKMTDAHDPSYLRYSTLTQDINAPYIFSMSM
uniref:Uncharacterized protein n=1 Tax=Anguilla anguilla TaxID=7936 RepID=A0A0E9VRV6_ANGAN